MLQHWVDRAADLPRRSLVWLTGLMVLVSAARYAQSPPRLTDDQTSNWWPVVNNLLDGKGFSQCLPEYFPFCTEGSPTAMREPLPLLLHAGVAAVSGRSLWAASLFQAVLNIVIAWLLYAVGKRLTNERTGMFAAALWALYLPAYQDLVNIGGDQMATSAVLIAVLLLLSSKDRSGARHMILPGACFGLAALCRSATIAFAIAAGASVLFHGGVSELRRSSLRATFFALGVALALAPWAVRNHSVFGRPLLGSSLSGYNLFRHNASLGSAHYCHFVAAEEGQQYLDSLIHAHPELTGRENEAEMNRLYASAGKEIIARHPVRYAVLCSYRLLPLCTNWGVNEAYGKPAGPLDHLALMIQLALLVLAAIGLAKGRISGKRMLVLGTALYALMHMAVVARLRFLFPAMPFVALLAAVALARIPALGKDEAPR